MSSPQFCRWLRKVTHPAFPSVESNEVANVVEGRGTQEIRQVFATPLDYTPYGVTLGNAAKTYSCQSETSQKDRFDKTGDYSETFAPPP